MRQADRKDWWGILIMFIVLVLIAIPAFAQPTGQWSEGHSRYHHKFKHMQNQRGMHCCNSTKLEGGDCSLTQARFEGGQWHMLVRGEWTAMDDPSDRVLDPMGIVEPFVCFGKYTEAVYCYSPGGGL